MAKTNARPAPAGWRQRLLELPRGPKRALLIINDFLLLSLALWAGFSLRLSTFYVPPTVEFALLLGAAPLIGVITFNTLGLYRLVTRYIGPAGARRIILAVGLAVTIWALLVLLAAIPGLLPRSTIIMYGIFSMVLVWGSRQLAGWFLRDLLPADLSRLHTDGAPTTAVIYGAGRTGVQLAEALKASPDYELIGFIDEDPSLWGQNLAGLKVYRPHKIAKLVRRNHVEEVLLALPNVSRRRRRTIIRRLEAFRVVVKTLPAMLDIATGRVAVSDLRHIDADDLLGREPIPPNERLMRRAVAGKVVMVTGAGGSIGSELTRQLVGLGPEKLILFDISEAALYTIEQELLASSLGREGRVVAVLGSVGDCDLVARTIEVHGVATVYHAAAYKHVPMVELNPIAGLRNNTFATRAFANVARSCGVERFVLVSTDKAVRPTSVMGASKRLAELVLQALAAEEPGDCIFTMVRFGNVLDSSGSVVGRFRKQIAQGGPVTVTHPEITRYFMSIPDAAQLVIQAGAMAKGGEVFVLDMGKPVKIDDLARSMIRLMGREVRDEDNPNGDIEIVYTGLRRGEKLYEELLIGEDAQETSHPRILQSNEPLLSRQQLDDALSRLEETMKTGEAASIRAVLAETIDGYRPENGGGATVEAKWLEGAPEWAPAASSSASPMRAPSNGAEAFGAIGREGIK